MDVLSGMVLVALLVAIGQKWVEKAVLSAMQMDRASPGWSNHSMFALR